MFSGTAKTKRFHAYHSTPIKNNWSGTLEWITTQYTVSTELKYIFMRPKATQTRWIVTSRHWYMQTTTTNKKNFVYTFSFAWYPYLTVNTKLMNYDEYIIPCDSNSLAHMRIEQHTIINFRSSKIQVKWRPPCVARTHKCYTTFINILPWNRSHTIAIWNLKKNSNFLQLFQRYCAVCMDK